MPTPVRTAAPQALAVFASQNSNSHHLLDYLSPGSPLILQAAPGYLVTDRLASLLMTRQPLFWLRLEKFDQDPGSLLVDLAECFSPTFPQVAAETLAEMRQRPGAIYGWEQHFSGLANRLREAQIGGAALVVEHIDHLGDITSTSLALFLGQFLALLPQIQVILSSHQPDEKALLSLHARVRTARDLRMNETDAWALSDYYPSRLPPGALRRALLLTAGCEGLLAGVLAVCIQLGVHTVAQIIESATRMEELRANLAGAWLADNTDLANALHLTIQVGYLHTGETTFKTNQIDQVPGEWLQKLHGDWVRLHCAWLPAIQHELSAMPNTEPGLTHDVLAFLLRNNLCEQAINFLIDQGLFQEAARMIMQVMNRMLDRGQWLLLSGWLERLPEAVRRDWPWLIYAQGEIHAGAARAGILTGHAPSSPGPSLTKARERFNTAAQIFTSRSEFDSASQCLLTESSLGIWQNDFSGAQASALQARANAQQTHQPWYQGWAEWQLGNLAYQTGDIPRTGAHLFYALEAASKTGDPLMLALIRRTQQLTQQLASTQEKKEAFRQAYFALETHERELSNQLKIAFEGPIERADHFLAQYGWSRTPMSLKLPTPLFPKSGQDQPYLSGFKPIMGGLAERLMHLFRPHTPADDEAPRPPTFPLSELPPWPVFIPDTGAKAASPTNAAAPGPLPAATNIPAPGASARTIARPPLADSASHNPDESTMPGLIDTPGSPKPALSTRPERRQSAFWLEARLLGNLSITISGNQIERWPGGRSRGVLGYLLAQRGEPVAREHMMETFWPDSSPDLARNNLNVAVHTLRNLLKPVTNLPVVLFQDNAYRLSPSLQLWLDFDVYEQHILNAQQLENAADPTPAIAAYEQAIALYQGDFLEDSPYEDWAVIERERLRVLHLDALDHLSLIYFKQREYATSANLCQRILARDNCREDAHSRLMRCYCRMGQIHLALRQYQTCMENLRTELDVSPSKAITFLYEQIRRRETV